MNTKKHPSYYPSKIAEFVICLTNNCTPVSRPVVILCCCLLYQTAFSQGSRFAFAFPSMGSQANLVIYSPDSIRATELSHQVKYLLDSLEMILSDYNPASEINQLDNTNTTSLQQVSPTLHEILLLSGNAYFKSHGAFDCSIGALTKCWRAAKKKKLLPSPDSLKQVLNFIGFNKIYISTDSLAIRFLKPGIQFDFGGIAKGYAAQKVVEMLRENEIYSSLMDMGGDIATGAYPPGTAGWTISINRPESATALIPLELQVSGTAVATSGKLYNFFEINGKKYSHIIDPKTGQPLLHNRQVTVAAGDGATADWLATACSVLTPRKSLHLVRQFPGTCILILVNKNDKIKAWHYGHYFE